MFNVFWPLVFMSQGRALVRQVEQRRTAERKLVGARPGAWVVDGEGVTVEPGGLRVARQEIDHGWIEPHVAGPLVVVRLRDGRRMIGRARDLDAASRLLTALGIDVSRQVTRLPLASRAVERGWGVGTHALVGYLLTWISLLMIVPLALMASSQIAGWAGIGVVLAIAVFAVRAYLSHVRRGQVTIGSDGVRVERGGEARFISYDDLQGVRETDRAVTLDLRNEQVALCTGGIATAEPEARAAIALRIREARTAFQRSEGSAPLLQLLERGGRAVEDWRRSLSSLVRERDYRAAAVAPGDLVGVAESASALIEHRLAAALALGASPAEETSRARVRVAAEACANPRVRVALTAAIDGTLDQAQLEEALAAEEGSQRDSTSSPSPPLPTSDSR